MLARIKWSRRALLTLAELMSDPDRSVRGAAAGTLVELAEGYVEAGDTDMIPVLVEVEREMRRRQPNYDRDANLVRSLIGELRGEPAPPPRTPTFVIR